MPLPKKTLPSLDSLDDFNNDDIQELNDSDFMEDGYQEDFSNSIVDTIQYENTYEDDLEDDEYEQTEYVYEDEDDLEEYNYSNDDSEDVPIKPKNKKDKKLLFIVLGSIIGVFLVIVSAYLLFFNNNAENKSTDNVNTTTQVVNTNNNNTDVTVKFDREENNGIVFLINAKNETIVNIQRVYEEEDGTLILCETGDLNLMEGEQEGFLVCSNTKNSKVSNSNKRVIKDTIINKSEEYK